MAVTFVGSDRPRVSVALRALRERRLVEHRRGQLRIVNRKGWSCAGDAPARSPSLTEP